MNFITGGYSLFVLFLCKFTCYGHNEVRLVDGNSFSGRVEVFLEGAWKSTVTQYWTKLEGGVVCRQLGFGGVHSVTHEEPTKDMNQATELTFKCEGYELSLLGCVQLDINDYQDSFYSYASYSSNSIAQVTCKTSAILSLNTVRLTDGGNYYGRVEVLLEGMWDRTCDTQWTKLEGGVVCRQLGYQGVYSVTHNPVNERETITNHSVRFACHGYEESLTDCVSYNLTLSNNTGVCDSAATITCLRSTSVSVHDFTIPAFELIWPISKNIYERKVGESLTLTCNVTAATEIWWKHRTWSKTIPVTHNNVLRLDNISFSDHGSYVCFAKGSRGQITESKPQLLLITDHAQIILTLEGRSSVKPSSGYWPVKVRNAVVEQFRKAAFNPVSVGNVNKTHFSLQLVQKLATGVHHNTIKKSEIDSLITGIQVFRTNFSRFNNAGYRIQGLSFCVGGPEDTSAGVLTFPSTVANRTVSSNESCFTSSDLPRASRKCEGDFVTAATWKHSVLHNCFEDLPKNSTETKSAIVQQFLTSVQEEDLSLDNVSAISHDLADITGSDVIKTEDIDQVANILNKISNVNSSSPTVTRNVLEVLDNVLTISTEDEGSTLVPETSSSLLTSLEQQLESVQQSGSNFSDNRPNIAVEVVQIQDFDLPITFASLDPESDRISETTLGQDIDNLDEQKIETSIQLPNYIIQTFRDCVVSDNASKVTFPVTFAIHRSEALFNDPQATKNELKQNSWVVSTSTLCGVSNLPRKHPISTQFSPTKEKTPTGSDGKCVFWDHDLRGEGIGGWSSKGCSNNKIEEVELYECVCSHLPRFANFAVLIDLKGSTNSFALYVLTVVGCLASICGLIITIVSYLSIKKIRSSQPQRITLNLCFALLCLYLCFLIGINRTDSSTTCIIFGVLIHLFCLSSVAWMSVEATQLYLLLVKVVNAHVKKFLMKAAFIAWGVPFIVVVICVAVRTDDYSHEYCFPKSSSLVFYIGVLALLALMLAYNVVIYITIIWNLCAARKSIARSKSNKTAVLRRFQNAFAISILLGLSWCFGFLAIGSLRMTFNVLFCLFNSFQGVFIFLIFCVRQEEVRAAWKNRFGIKSRPKKREDASTSQSKLLSTTKDVPTESEITTKASSKAFGEIQQFELVEAEDSCFDIQATTTFSSQNESQGSSKAPGEAEQSEVVKAEDGCHEIQTTMTSSFQNESQASSKAPGEINQSDIVEAEGGCHDIQRTMTSTFQNELQPSKKASEETKQSEVVKAEDGRHDLEASTTSTFQNELQASNEPSGGTQQSEGVKAEDGRHDIQAPTTSTFQNVLKTSSEPSGETEQSEPEADDGRHDFQATTTSTLHNELQASSEPSGETQQSELEADDGRNDTQPTTSTFQNE